MRPQAGREKIVAPPGLLHRRYSAPETVMRKYRLEQLKAQESNRTPEMCTCALSDAEAGSAGTARRNRGVVRSSALLRRLRGRVTCTCACRCTPACRSLDASRSELRPTFSASASGRTSPKRLLRVDSSTTLSPLGVSSAAERDAAISSLTDTYVGIGSASETSSKNVSETGLRGSGIMGDATPTVGTDGCGELHDGSSFANSSDTFTVTTCTTRDAARMTPSSATARTDDGQQRGNDHPRESAVTTRPRSYDILEIVVSESLDTNYTSGSNVSFSDSAQKRQEKRSPEKYNSYKDLSGDDIDEYVSGILVESLNSLTDQLESMNASFGANGKLNIIEKEIKIKLQNTGVNTIVHLSPTSNNQIIFGHEELCSSDERRESCDGQGAPSPAPRDQPAGANRPARPARPALPHHSNSAVLQQIQRLFQDDFQVLERDALYSNESMSSISHIEISKANVYVENESASYCTTAEAIEKPASSVTSEVISGVGASNYYENIADNALVARFSAFPHSESMEVNTSSSEDPDMHGSECASLVDSLDDPNSPRSIAFSKSASRRSELVRSSIDVLDLLPENACRTESAASKDKGEAFFVTIKDDHCECDRESKDIVVADHMPETIKQRLYRRHRNRELRLERARRCKAQQLRRELAHQRHGHLRSANKEVEREGISLVKSLIDDAILKIIQDELKCMRIKQKSVLMVSAKSDESLCAKNRKKDVDLSSHCKKLSKNSSSQSCSEGIDKKYRKEKFQIRGKLSLQAYPSSPRDDSKSKRIYQKSEIHDGKRCIEILEILEYVSSSASSPDTSNSDENHSAKIKKSRIPVPVSDRVSSQQINTSKSSAASSDATSINIPYNMESMSVHSPSAARDVIVRADAHADGAAASARRRSATPHCEPRSRSNSLRFKRVFDMIPEEKSIASVESVSEDHMHCRRASLPTLSDNPSHVEQESFKKKEGVLKINCTTTGIVGVNSISDSTTGKETRSAGTSPMPNKVVHRSVLTQTHAVGSSTSPNRSAGTSPIRNMSMSTQTLSPRRKSTPNQYPKIKIQQVSQSLQRRREQSRGPFAQQHPQHPQPPRPPGGGNGRREKTVRQEEGVRLPLCGAGAGAAGGAGGTADCSSSSSSESGGLLCALAPGWLHRDVTRSEVCAGQWAVTVAGSCRATLPTDVEMRLRFPDTALAPRACPPRAAQPAHPLCRAERCVGRRSTPARVALALTKEASDSSILASKSVKKSVDSLPEVETFRASRTSTKHSVKTRRCSPACWLPDRPQDGARPLPRVSEALSVRGAAIVPARKPRPPRPQRPPRPIITSDHRDLCGLCDRQALNHRTT
ncbi:serine-rich adhesin for platelets-like [Papilio machaon]|uniref:serine-rich adhesin for platelets-like n=1 Tax=Papilio machaon TaxID=76193 RepID=UPI001E663418|nr:serine-rich adhesin for platelets-like [Papilio machaon]